MTEIPAEAVRSAAEAIGLMILGVELDRGRSRYTFEQLAEVGLNAAYPALAAQVRRQTLRDVAEGRVTLEEHAAAQGITGPQRIEDLAASSPVTDEEADAFLAASHEPSCCDQARREAAKKIAREILRQKPAGNTRMTWRSGLKRAARVAVQIGEADDHRA